MYVRTLEAARMLAVASCLVALLSCAGPEPSAAGGDGKPGRAEVEATTEKFHQALRTNDADRLFSFVADDVVMMPPGEAAIRGKAAMREWYAAFLSQFRTSSLVLGDREVFVGAGWAVEVGSYEWGLEPAAGGGDPAVDRGHYMQVWRRRPDGRWQFAREIWNSTAPPPAAAGK